VVAILMEDHLDRHREEILETGVLLLVWYLKI
jgi:hypothetical protein